METPVQGGRGARRPAVEKVFLIACDRGAEEIQTCGNESLANDGDNAADDDNWERP